MNRRVLIATLLAVLTASAGPVSATPPDPGSEAAQIRLATRRALENGRALQKEDRLEAAERVLRRGLRLEPDHAALLRALAGVLEAQGRPAEARETWRRADSIDPPPGPLPEAALPGAGRGWLVVLVKADPPPPGRGPGRWPEQPLDDALRTGVATRLPEAAYARADLEETGEALRWLEEREASRLLTLRLERAYCGFTVKDGRVAVGRLRAAVAVRGAARARIVPAEVVLEEPRGPGDCRAEAVARALETVLGSDAWQEAAAAEAGPGWQADAMGTLFPAIGRRVAEWVRAGRAMLAVGELEEARRRFESAAAVDPTDADVRTLLDDTRRSLALAREIAGEDAEDAGSLDPRLTPAQRAAAEVALDRERGRRDELLGALEMLEEDVRLTSAESLDTLRPVGIHQPDGFGPRLARERAGGPVSARAAYAPDGTVLARYYFPDGAERPVLREEDTNRDGAPDRWIAYRDEARSDIFEDGRGAGRPNLHLIFEPGGSPLARVEIDVSGDGDPDRVFRYEEGALHAEEIDTDGDGVLDRFDRLDDEGRVGLREEDLNGDGAIDVRSIYRGGKLVRREITDPDSLPES